MDATPWHAPWEERLLPIEALSVSSTGQPLPSHLHAYPPLRGVGAALGAGAGAPLPQPQAHLPGPSPPRHFHPLAVRTTSGNLAVPALAAQQGAQGGALPHPQRSTGPASHVGGAPLPVGHASAGGAPVPSLPTSPAGVDADGPGDAALASPSASGGRKRGRQRKAPGSGANPRQRGPTSLTETNMWREALRQHADGGLGSGDAGGTPTSRRR